MKALITNWLNSRAEELRLIEDHDEILLRHGPDTLLLQVQLTQGRPDKSQLNTWMLLGIRPQALHRTDQAIQQPAKIPR